MQESNLFCKFKLVKKKGIMKKAQEKSRKMLAYSKNVLSKMTFDITLFKKELSKAYQNLLEEEIEELMNWVMEKFGPQYVLKPIPVRSK